MRTGPRKHESAAAAVRLLAVVVVLTAHGHETENSRQGRSPHLPLGNGLYALDRLSGPGRSGHAGPGIAPDSLLATLARLDASHKPSNKPVWPQRLLPEDLHSDQESETPNLQVESSPLAGVAQSVRAAES